MTKRKFNDLVLARDFMAGAIKKRTLEKLVKYKARRRLSGPILQIIYEEHRGGKSIRQQAREIGVSIPTLSNIYSTYEISHRSNAEAVRKMLEERWKDLDLEKDMLKLLGKLDMHDH
jgi:hypothetical protein